MIEDPSCSECGQLNCYRRDSRAPRFCLTGKLDGDLLAQTVALYREEGGDGRIARAAAEVEGLYYGKLSRVEETVAFANRIAAKRIGIASCLGLIEESRILARVLRAAGFEAITVLCKVGSVDKTGIGIAEELKVQSGSFEACCNPVLQAKLLAQSGTDLNVIMGLCVGHDALFTKHSAALVTTLVVKDRVNGHNPVASLLRLKFQVQHLSRGRVL